jgi:ligand-binding sensor domain-containing protein
MTFYLGTAEEGLLILHRSADGETFWVAPQDDEASQYVRTRAGIRSFQAHPLDLDTVYVGTDAGIYVSGDAGQSWRLVASALHHERVHALLIAPDGETLYAGLDRGIVYSTDGGASWSALGAGLRHATVYALALGEGESPALFAGTNRGLWRLSLPPSAGDAR